MRERTQTHQTLTTRDKKFIGKERVKKAANAHT